MHLTEEREAEIREEIRKLALSLIASGRVDPTKGEPDYGLLIEAYRNYSSWLAKAEAIVVDTISQNLENFGKKKPEHD